MSASSTNLAMADDQFVANIQDSLNERDSEHLRYLMDVTNELGRAHGIMYGRLADGYLRYQHHYLDALWKNILTLRYKALVEIYSNHDLEKGFKYLCELVEEFNRYIVRDTSSHPGQTSWMMRALYTVCKNLLSMAISMDKNHQNKKHLEASALILQKCFSSCLNDRTTDDLTQSNKIGTYGLASLLLNNYIKLNRLSLGANVVRSIEATDLPPFDTFPLAQRVTYKFYVGYIEFAERKDAEAIADLTYALENCHLQSIHNIKYILRLLVPLKLRQGILPTDAVLSFDPLITMHYSPFVKSIRTGDIQPYRNAIQRDRKWLAKNRILTTVQSLEMLVLRTYIKNCWITYNRPDRLTVEQVYSFLRASDQFDGSMKDAEWTIAYLITNKYIRGYISSVHKIIVLAKQNSFPRLPSLTY